MSETFEYTEKDQLSSTWLKECHYNKVTLELAVTMKNNKTYVYTNVPWDVYEDLVKVYSAGTYYNDYIRGIYNNKHGDAIFVSAFQKYTETEVRKMQTERRRFVVRAEVVLEHSVMAGSIEEAVEIFKQTLGNKGEIKVKEVVVPFE